MSRLVKILALVSFSNVLAEEFKLSGLFFGCERDVTLDYHKGLQDFSTRLYKNVASRYEDHFALSQYSIWLALAGLAEGSKMDVQNKLFGALNLPKDACLREKYYEITTSLESPGNDVSFKRKRLFLLDDGLKVNQTWAREVRASGLVETKIEAVRNRSTNQINELTEANITEQTIAGNSIIIDLLDYNGLWTTTFENSSIEHNADFYNDEGIKIGKVDLMRMKKRVKLAYIPLLNAKLLELPVGNNGRYRMLFILNVGRNKLRRTIENFPSSLIVDSMPVLIESLIPLDVAIPKFRITSEIDLTGAISDVGLGDVWSEGAASFISDPPAPPSAAIQRVTINIDSPGLETIRVHSGYGLTELASELATGLASAAGREFTANRPFIFGLVDSTTRTWLFSGIFSKP